MGARTRPVGARRRAVRHVLRLRAAARRARRAATAIAREAGIGPAHNRGMSPLHIAVLDDEADITRLLASYLQGHGFRVTQLHAGARADAR